MSETENFPETFECVACGKELITERYMGIYPDEDTPNDCIHMIHNVDMPPFTLYCPCGHFIKNLPKAATGKF